MQLSIGWALGGAGTSLPLSQGPLGFALEPDLFSVLISVQLYQLFPSTSSCKRKRSKKKKWRQEGRQWRSDDLVGIGGDKGGLLS